MTIIPRNLTSLSRASLAIVLGFALAAPAPASAESGDDAQAEATDYRGPRGRVPVYRPGRRVPVYRPAPRRVYVVPTYAPRPRRFVETPSPAGPMFSFAIGVNGTSVLGSKDSPITQGLGSGAGFELNLGWRVAPQFSVDVNWLMSFHDAKSNAAGPDGTLSSFSIGGRAFLTDPSRRTQPYVQLGLGAYLLGRDNWDFDALTGVGLELGGGIDFYLSQSVSIGAKVLYRGAYLDNAESTWSQFPTESTWLSALTYGGDLRFHF